MPSLKKNATLDLPLPNEIMEKILNDLPPEDLLSLCIVGNKRIKNCSYNLLRREPNGKYC